MSDPEEKVRIEPPVAGDDTSTMLGSLERVRATFAWKCGGLDSDGLRAKVGVSAVTLGGLLKHMALVEEHSFAGKYLGQELGAPWNDVDWDNDPDWEWRTAADDSLRNCSHSGRTRPSVPARSLPKHLPREISIN